MSIPSVVHDFGTRGSDLREVFVLVAEQRSIRYGSGTIIVAVTPLEPTEDQQWFLLENYAKTIVPNDEVKDFLDTFSGDRLSVCRMPVTWVTGP